MPGFDPASHSHITKRDRGSMPAFAEAVTRRQARVDHRLLRRPLLNSCQGLFQILD
jgi:hypothetical protein